MCVSEYPSFFFFYLETCVLLNFLFLVGQEMAKGLGAKSTTLANALQDGSSDLEGLKLQESADEVTEYVSMLLFK